MSGPHHKLPRSASEPHTSGFTGPPATFLHTVGFSRESTVVRIPLQSAKFHFGTSTARGTRPYNEDTYQAGVIEVPAFAKRFPISFTRNVGNSSRGESTSAENPNGDPQCFYFGIFDGHGGSECSRFLRDQLHTYIEDASQQLGLRSSLQNKHLVDPGYAGATTSADDRGGQDPSSPPITEESINGSRSSQSQSRHLLNAIELQRTLFTSWAQMVGGYFKRFRPQHLQVDSNAQSGTLAQTESRLFQPATEDLDCDDTSLETVLTYAFLKADLDFIAAQVKRADEDPVRSDRALNEDEIFGEARRQATRASGREFLGGSTCSVAMISTPTPTPFWNPTSSSTIVTSHVGDTRILMCRTADGRAIPMTTNHHPSSAGEGNRLRRFAASFVTDSFGEERMGGLANTRAFGDIHSKRLGVSAEPEIRRMELQPAEYSFLALVSDGISGLLTDQEIVDIVKESKTPEQGAKDLVAYATEVNQEGDNATCMVIRLGGWERRIEGGLGAMGTKEIREWRRQEATEPLNRRT